RAIDIGQLADLDAVEGREARHGDERVEDESQHRPTDEEGREARTRERFAVLAVRHAGQLPPPGLASARSATRTSLPSRTLWTPSVTTRSPAARGASTSTSSVFRWTTRTGMRFTLSSLTIQTKAPSDPHITASGLTAG